MAKRFDVRGFRDTHGMTAQRLADHLGVHIRSVHRWEAGDADPSPLALKQLKDLQREHDAQQPAKSHVQDPTSSAPRRPSLVPNLGR